MSDFSVMCLAVSGLSFAFLLVAIKLGVDEATTLLKQIAADTKTRAPRESQARNDRGASAEPVIDTLLIRHIISRPT